MTKDNPDETSIEKVETEPVRDTATTEEQKGEGQPLEAADPLPVAQLNSGITQQPNTADAEEETDRKQDEAITSLAEQTKWIKRQTNWIAGQVIASSVWGALTLGVLLYHGWIMGWQSQAMRDQTEIMKGQLQSMNDSSGQTERLIRANESLAEQNRQMVGQAGEQTEVLKDSVAAAEQSARAAQSSAAFAEKAVEATKEATFIANRGYLTINKILPPEFVLSKPFRIYIVWENDGSSPTQMREGGISVGFTTNSEPVWSDCNPAVHSAGVETMVVEPRTARTQRYTFSAMSQQQVTGVESGNRLIICGSVSYETLGHVSPPFRFCSYWDRELKDYINCKDNREKQ